MESIDDPVTNSRKPSTCSTYSTNITARPPRPWSLVTGRRHHEQLHSTEGLQEPQRSLKSSTDQRTREGLSEGPPEEPSEGLSEGWSSPQDSGLTPACEPPPVPCDRLLGVCDCSLCDLSWGHDVASTFSPLSACAVTLAALLVPRRIRHTQVP